MPAMHGYTRDCECFCEYRPTGKVLREEDTKGKMMSSIRVSAKNLVRHLILRTRYARYLLPQYESEFYPPNLTFLATELMKRAEVPGNVLEVGCYRGGTSIWLCKALQAIGSEKRYFALDTFEGFPETHVAHEVSARGKDEAALRRFFVNNSQFAFDKTMEVNGFDFVKSIKADAAEFDYAPLGNMAFALIDVDLYLPVKAALQKVVPLMSPGGCIVIDDCVTHGMFDGAYAAFKEYAEPHGLPLRIENNKLGVIEC